MHSGDPIFVSERSHHKNKTGESATRTFSKTSQRILYTTSSHITHHPIRIIAIMDFPMRSNALVFDSSCIKLNSWISWMITLIALVLSYLWFVRQRTKRRLERCGLPTVFWRPKFVNYLPSSEEDSQKKLGSSTITNILPRMKRLGGPFGMYGTVYGVNTSVVHVAHPVPARAIFSSIPQ